MELQTDDSAQIHSSENYRNTAPPSSSTSASTPTLRLRFPRPRVNEQLVHYISQSSPDIRQASSMSDSGNMAESAYEIINTTDSESQDGQLSESIGSLDISRPDDVHSLDGSDAHYDTDTDDEPDHSSNASSIRYADEVLQSPSRHISVNSVRYSTASLEAPVPPAEPIELREDIGESSEPEKISAKRVIREYSDEEMSELAEQLKMPATPSRMVIVVRQTMSRAYLSTGEPLRVLYVGRPAAKRDIVMKISSAIWASSESTAAGNPFTGQRDEVYNIVPISGFGSSPELDLMKGSHYQIKVEHCTSACEHHSKNRDGVLATYSITIGHDITKTYKTSISTEGTLIQPQWTPPHVAVFYCSDNEDAEEAQTRRAAWEFMNSHNIPSIFISESEIIGKSSADAWEERVNQNAPHLSLESRDSERPLSQRFPIDITSFLNLDSRQVNRNLAYLTKLLEPVEPSSEGGALEIPSGGTYWQTTLRKTWQQKPNREKVLEYIEQNKWFVALFVPIFMALFAPYLMGACPSRGTEEVAAPSIRHGSSTGVLGFSSTSCIAQISKTTKPAPTSTTTVVINVTSTKTVQISHALPSTSSVASVLSFAGFLSDKPSAAPAEPEVKKTVCVVRVYSPNELLVEIPSGSKATWLAKGAIDIDVYRGGDLVKTKLSSVDEGILVELGQKDAYGVLNVSVITSRKPKINETFEVDFGKTVVAETIEAGMHLLKDMSRMVFAGRALDTSKKRYDDTVNRVKNSLGPNYQRAKDKVQQAKDEIRRAKDKLAYHLETARYLRKQADMSILNAQIASKLWWLKIRGKEEEFAQYQRNASLFMKARYAATLLGKDKRSQAPEKESRGAFGRFGRKHQLNHNEARPDDSRDRGWKKMIMG